jgi:hypothetical protein
MSLFRFETKILHFKGILGRIQNLFVVLFVPHIYYSYKYLFQKKLKVSPLTEYPLLKVKVDIDSLYYGAPTLEELVEVTGSKGRYSMSSLRSHFFASTGSRFSIECGDLVNYPITNRGFNPKKIGFHRLPNVVLADCLLEKACGHQMTIYISFTGVERIRQTNFFYKEEMAVINSAMNLAVYDMKIGTRTNAELNEVADQISRFPTFETKVKGDFGKNLKNRRTVIGPKAMKMFARKFDEALLSFELGGGVKTCMDPKFNGMRYDTNKSELAEVNVKKAIEALNKGHYFSANLAGIKNSFKERSDLSLTMDAHFYSNRIIETSTEPFNAFEHIQAFVQSKVPILYEELRSEIMQVVRGSQFIYYFDIGVELASLDPKLDLVTMTEPANAALVEILNKA